jgi:hypothetical protein
MLVFKEKYFEEIKKNLNCKEKQVHTLAIVLCTFEM